ncbi:hypothetical protein BD770DRAFT_461716 [Pilaira anomala]|nr:hypothetical protein BD770DRAFT_461716 [Pilaira anomala]
MLELTTFQHIFSQSYLYLFTVILASAASLTSLTYGFYKFISSVHSYVFSPCFEVRPPWQVRKVFNFRMHSKPIQAHMKTLQLWIITSNSKSLSVFMSQRKNPTTQEKFCQSVLLELLDKNRSKDLQKLLDFLHSDLTDCQPLAEALAYIILVALDIDMDSSTCALDAMTRLLCTSRDSLIFDFVLMGLKDDHTQSLGVTTTNYSGYDQYKSFLQSPTPTMNKIELFFYKAPVIKYLVSSCKIFKDVDITPTMFRCLLERVRNEIQLMKADFLKIPTLPAISQDVLVYNPHRNKGFKVTPMNISFFYMGSYKSLYTNLETRLNQLKSGLDFSIRLQDCKPISSSPLISPYLSQIKDIYRSTISLFRNQEQTLFQFEQAFVISQICQNDIISTDCVKRKFSSLAYDAKGDKYIEQKDFQKLKTVVDRNLQLTINLEKAFKMSLESNCWNLKFKELCQSRIDEVKKVCEEHIKMCGELIALEIKLRPSFDDVTNCLKKQKEAVTKEEETAAIEVYIKAFDVFDKFLKDHDMTLDTFEGRKIKPIQKRDDTESMTTTKKIIQGMVNFVSDNLYKCKENNKKHVKTLGG